jgi:hypothetical protein
MLPVLSARRIVFAASHRAGMGDGICSNGGWAYSITSSPSASSEGRVIRQRAADRILGHSVPPKARDIR